MVQNDGAEKAQNVNEMTRRPQNFMETENWKEPAAIDRIAVMTGATGGIGSHVCARLIEKGYTVYAACRNAAKGERFRQEMAGSLSSDLPPAVTDSRLILIPADLKSFASTDRFTDRIISLLGTGISGEELSNDREPPENAGGNGPEAKDGRRPAIGILINNAGIIAPRFEVTEDGYESSLQVNYLAPRRIIRRLLPYLHPQEGRIINTVSCTIRIASPDPYIREWLRADEEQEPENLKLSGQLLEEQKRHFRNLKNYGNSKWLLAVHTARLHESLRLQGSGIRVFGADPGIVNTNIITLDRWFDPLADLFFRPFIKTPRQGAVPLVRAAEYPFHPDRPLLFKGKKEVSFPANIQAFARREFPQ